MKHALFSAVLLAGLGLGTFGPVSAQNATIEPVGAQAFSPENAILNTAILFGVGAREAQQSLRGSFGWATFQEGLVRGIYFRFDPDGYARFSPSPRLDSDVFEVLCRPRTYVCMARKGPLTITLSSTGQIQMALEQSTTEDQFFLNDGFSELQVPPRVIGTLDPQLENLLGSGGTLVSRRNGSVLEEVPLTGLPIVTAYLRWIVARQDYTVLPADWPIPLAKGPNPSTLTQPANWQSPNRAVAIPVAAPEPAVQVAPAEMEPTPEVEAVPDTMLTPIATNESQLKISALQAEVAFLKDLVLAQTGSTTPALSPSVTGTAQVATLTTPTHWDHSAGGDIGSQIAQLDSMMHPTGTNPALGPGALSYGVNDPSASRQPDQSMMGEDGIGKEAQHLHYLTAQMGFDAHTAILVLQLNTEQQPDAVMSEHDATVAEILASIAQDTPITTNQRPMLDQMDVDASNENDATPDQAPDYQLLTDYFNSVVMADPG